MKPVVIRLRSGKVYHDVEVRPFDQLTVAQYRNLTEFPEGETQLETIVRVFGVDPIIARGLSMAQANELLAWYGQWLQDGINVQGIARGVLAGFPPGKAWTLKEATEAMQEAAIHRTTFDVVITDGDGDTTTHTFIVPQQIEAQCTFGQFNSLEEKARDHGDKPEAELWPNVLASFCLKAGEEYDDAFVAGLPDRRLLMGQAKASDAIAVSAFFFSSCDEFSRIIRRYMTNFLWWHRPLTEPEPMSTIPDTSGSADWTPLPTSTPH